MLTILSLGAGVQSTTMALMAAHGEITPMPDCAIFADTGGEAAATYEHIEWLRQRLPFPIERVQRNHLGENVVREREDGSGSYVVIPAYIEHKGQPRLIISGCSKDWKTRPVARRIKELLGGKGAAVQWLGITTDEAHRMKPHESPWIENQWPLIERGLSRTDCRSWLHRHDYPQPPKSSCVWCVMRGEAGFARLTEAERAVAADVDRRIRHAVSDGKGELYLRRDLRPFDDERAVVGQGDLFGNECEGMCGV